MVGHSLVARGTIGFALWFALTTVLGSVLSTAALAQNIGAVDFESPIIEHEERNGGQRGTVEVFGATVVDNERINDVLLRYRYNGQTDFTEIPMKEIGISSFYSARVDTSEVPDSSDSIEYYIRAEDTSGNLTLRGFAFQPLKRPFQIASSATAPVLTADTTPQADSESNQESALATEEPWQRKVNWVYVALGALVVGGIAAASQSGGSDSGTGGTTPTTDECAAGCDFTFTFERP